MHHMSAGASKKTCTSWYKISVCCSKLMISRDDENGAWIYTFLAKLENCLENCIEIQFWFCDMCKLLNFPNFPSVGKLKTIFKTNFSFGISLQLYRPSRLFKQFIHLSLSRSPLGNFLIQLNQAPDLLFWLTNKKQSDIAGKTSIWGRIWWGGMGVSGEAQQWLSLARSHSWVDA